MFKRVMVAVVGLPLLILILGWAPSWATMLLLAAMCAIGAWELMRAAAGERGKPLTPLTVIAAAAVPVCVYGEMSIENTELTALPVLPFAALLGAVFIFAIFALAIHRYDEEQGIPFAAVTCAIFAGLAFPLMFSCLLRLRMMPAIGMLQVFLPLLCTAVLVSKCTQVTVIMRLWPVLLRLSLRFHLSEMVMFVAFKMLNL